MLLSDFQQTALILIPEFILLFTAMGIMTASAFVSRPRRFWCAISAGCNCGGAPGPLEPEGHDRPAVLGGRLERRSVVLRPPGALVAPDWSCWRLRTASQPTSGGRVFRRLAHGQRRGDAGGRGQRAGLPVRRARAGEHSDLPAALPLASQSGHAGSRDQVFLPEHLFIRPAPLRPGVPVRHDRASAT